MKITTGTIVFNGEKLTPKGMLEAQLKQLYYLADQIIIVEGATRADNKTHYFDGDATWCTENGHSTDNTVKIIKEFPDPDKKIVLIEAAGFWNGKTQMCNEWSKIATGNYIWQIDVDEFYQKNDIDKMKKILEKYDPNAVHFFANHFWGDFYNCIDESCPFTWGNNLPWQRIFKHKPGSKWERHEPPTYILPDGTDCNTKQVIPREETLKAGIKMYHYSYVTPEQISFKAKFYNQQWTEETYKKWLGNHATLVNGSRTVEFKGEHPVWLKEVLHAN
jgi:hypothetical protein